MEEYTLTEEDIKCCINAIEDLDDDKNGYISVYDFDTVLDKLGIELSEIEIAKLVSELDHTYTGFINFGDILELFRKKREMDERGEDDQDTLDAYVAIGGPEDKSGHINGKILVTIIKEEFQLPINIEKLIEEIDDSGNGEIEYEEFERLLKSKHTATL